MHWHRYFEIGLCLEGSGKFLYSHKEYSSSVGDIFINNDYENHVAITEDNKTNKYIFLILMPYFISDFSNNRASQQFIKAFRYNPPDFINRIANGTPTAIKLAKLIQRGYIIYQAKENMWEMKIDIIVRNILSELTNHYSRKDSEESARKNINHSILIAQQFIHNNYRNPLTLRIVSEQAKLNPTYFRHLFKEEIRISFKEYVTRLRLMEACHLLKSSDISIYRIIEHVGYTNISQFYRIFRQHYHMTPAEYRALQIDTQQRNID